MCLITGNCPPPTPLVGSYIINTIALYYFSNHPLKKTNLKASWPQGFQIKSDESVKTTNQKDRDRNVRGSDWGGLYAFLTGTHPSCRRLYWEQLLDVRVTLVFKYTDA